MSGDAEVDMKDVELNEVDPERQPMTTGNGDANSALAVKNGIVKVKIPDETESKFTGLSKEELLKVAGTPGYGCGNSFSHSHNISFPLPQVLQLYS